MYGKMKKTLISTLILAVLSFMGVFAAYAAENSCTVSIPVEVQVTGSNVPSDAAYRFAMEAVTEGAPMPENAVITATGSGVIQFGPIEYTQLRDYQYTIRQITEDRSYFNFQQTTYYVTVRIIRDEEGSYSSLIMVSDSADTEAKPSAISFTNSYEFRSSGGRDDGGSSDRGVVTRRPGDGLTTIGEEATPLADLASDLDPIAILDELVPLAGGLLPQTGDSTMAMLWAILMVLSGGMLVTLIATRNKFA